LRTIDGPDSVVAFSPDGKQLMTIGRSCVLVWNIELDERSPDEVARVVAAKSPWQLVDGRLERR
jgi:hypothetical protein